MANYGDIEAPKTLPSGLAIGVIGPTPMVSFGAEPAATAGAGVKVDGEDATPKALVPPDIKFTPEAESRLCNYLRNEINIARSERSQYISKLARLKEKYKAPFPETPKDFPIANSSQITIPLIKMAVNTLSARIHQTMVAAEPLASIRTTDSAFQDFAFTYEQFLDIYSDEILKMPDLLDTWTSEIIMLGTGVLESSTVTVRKVGMVYDQESPSGYRRQTEDVHSGPVVYHIPIEDFWIRPTFNDLQTAPWCGKEVRLTWSQIKEMAFSGEFNPDKIDQIWRRGGTADMQMPETVLKQEELEKMKPVDHMIYPIHELAVKWDTDMDGYDEEIMVYFHEPSMTILRCKYSGFKRRPWHVARFVRIPHWFYGEGMAEQLEAMQEEISTTHNQRIDNATIANLKVILVRRLIQGLRPGDRLWTGKVVRVSDVKADVGTLALGDIYPSTVTNEQLTLGYVDRLSGMGDVASGQAKPVTRTTATAQLALLEELNRRFDKTVRGMRRTLREVYADITDLFLVTGTSGYAEEWLGASQGRKLETFLSMPSDIIRRKIKVQVKATRSTVNREVEFQSQIAVFNLIIQLWQQIRGEAAQLAPQSLPLLAGEMVKAILPVFKKIMQYADAPDPDQAIAVLTTLQHILPNPEDFGGMATAQADETQAAVDRLAERTRNDLTGPSQPSPDASDRRLEAAYSSPQPANGRGKRVPNGSGNSRRF